MAASGIGYVCAPLFELPVDERRGMKKFCRDIGEILENAIGLPACIPHDHMGHSQRGKRRHEAGRIRRCKDAKLLVIVAIPNWYAWRHELEIAKRRYIPVILLCWQGYAGGGEIPVFLVSDPSIQRKIFFFSKDEAMVIFARVVTRMWGTRSSRAVQPALALV